MRLIDADNFLERFEKMCETETDNVIAAILRGALINEPIAYDINKVVEKLNELDVTAIKRYEGGTFGNYEGTDYYIKKSDAIEIVKHGGVSDDVCEWKLFKGHKFLHKTSCGNVFDMQKGFKYCPYCGKKIKIVGD